MSTLTLLGLGLAVVGLLAMIEDGRYAFGATACVVGGLALAALGTTGAGA